MDLCIETWNVRSMYRTGTWTKVILCLERYRLDITVDKEVRRDRSGSLVTKKYNFI